MRKQTINNVYILELNRALGNAEIDSKEIADKRVRYFEDRVESLPNSQRLLTLGNFALADIEARHGDLLNRLTASYGHKL